jgi:hypothetical protein
MLQKLSSLCNSDSDPWQLVDAIKVPTSKRTSSQRLENVPAFLKWLGIPDTNFCIAPSQITGAGLAVYATTSIAKDQEVFTVPDMKIMRVSNSADVNLSHLISKDRVIFGNESLQLALLLLVEDSKSASIWRPYLNVLPRDFPSLPCNMTRFA